MNPSTGLFLIEALSHSCSLGRGTDPLLRSACVGEGVEKAQLLLEKIRGKRGSRPLSPSFPATTWQAVYGRGGGGRWGRSKKETRYNKGKSNGFIWGRLSNGFRKSEIPHLNVTSSIDALSRHGIHPTLNPQQPARQIESILPFVLAMPLCDCEPPQPLTSPQDFSSGVASLLHFHFQFDSFSFLSLSLIYSPSALSSSYCLFFTLFPFLP